MAWLDDDDDDDDDAFNGDMAGKSRGNMLVSPPRQNASPPSSPTPQPSTPPFQLEQREHQQQSREQRTPTNWAGELCDASEDGDSLDGILDAAVALDTDGCKGGAALVGDQSGSEQGSHVESEGSVSSSSAGSEQGSSSEDLPMPPLLGIDH
jgi:hypothetical protein